MLSVILCNSFHADVWLVGLVLIASYKEVIFHAVSKITQKVRARFG